MLAGFEESLPGAGMSAIRTLMTQAIDYAGLFPPASLGMADAVRNYARYASGPDAWALGNFVLPLASLREFEAAAAGLGLERRIPLTVILPGVEFDVDAVKTGLSFGIVRSAEVRVDEPAQVGAVASLAAPGVDSYFEIPARHDWMDVLAAIAEEGERAKVRTGGVERGSIPSPLDVVNFMAECARARVAFKATAGLHHALRGEHALTYEADAPTETMHGFLNVLLAAALVFAGGDDGAALRTVEETRADAFRFSEDAVAWDGKRLSLDDLRYAREQFVISFGSCSFDEPLADLRALRLI